MCGENILSGRMISVIRGSPPRVRGKQTFANEEYFVLRITPACAGKTPFDGAHFDGVQDHPRVCGENVDPVHTVPRAVGSPPRVRGKRAMKRQGVKAGGITPACAGKTFKMHYFAFSARDHPRVCGENSHSVLPSASVLGSPPRVRGKPAFSLTASSNVRITPACAGKTGI